MSGIVESFKEHLNEEQMRQIVFTCNVLEEIFPEAVKEFLDILYDYLERSKYTKFEYWLIGSIIEAIYQVTK